MKTYLAADLGAGSGRVMAAKFDGGKFSIEEICRFDNTPLCLNGHWHWNVTGLYANVIDGIRRGAGMKPVSVGLDTWGVDYGFLDGSGRLLGLPYYYRDSRTDGMMDKVFAKIGRRRLYDRTGIQFMPLNTIFQLAAEELERDPLTRRAERMLFIPDLMNYWLSGTAVNELTIASTSQCLDVNTHKWDLGLMSELGIPAKIFGDIVKPGVKLGKLRDFDGIDVVEVGTHDTASAIASVPVVPGSKWAYLATGTWALMGIESDKSIVNDESYEFCYTHELGANGKYRFLKNITGMWVYQELRRCWKEAGDQISYDEMTALAEKSKPLVSIIDPDYGEFTKPGRMVEKIADYCRRTGQPVPADKGAFARCALESMVLRYREVWLQLERLTGVKRDVLNMIGGATRNKLHCQMTADAIGAPVVCGPTEGAVCGNVLMQMIAEGDAANLDEAREIVRASESPVTYEPNGDGAQWAAAAERLAECRQKVDNAL